jgi:hypothetical protein
VAEAVFLIKERVCFVGADVKSAMKTILHPLMEIARHILHTVGRAALGERADGSFLTIAVTVVGKRRAKTKQAVVAE